MRTSARSESGVVRMNNRIVDVLREEAEKHLVCVREDYSGRAMYGRKCFGIVGSQWSLAEVVGWARERLAGIDIPQPKTDSMGLDDIWYWPELEGDPERSIDASWDPLTTNDCYNSPLDF